MYLSLLHESFVFDTRTQSCTCAQIGKSREFFHVFFSPPFHSNDGGTNFVNSLLTCLSFFCAREEDSVDATDAAPVAAPDSKTKPVGGMLFKGFFPVDEVSVRGALPSLTLVHFCFLGTVNQF